MYISEEDAPVLKEWIVKRLEDTSDADSDVLADYVLALLGNANNDTNIKEVFDAEITPFLKKDTKGFTNDIIQAIKHRSYIPGAPPPPPPPELQLAAAAQTIFGAPNPNQPYFPTGPAAAGRKRGFQDRSDFDAPGGHDHSQDGGRAFKQARRGGGRKGYVDPDRPQLMQEQQYGYNPRAPGLNANAPSLAPAAPRGDMASFGTVGDPMAALRQLQELQQQMGLLASFQNLSQQQGYSPNPRPQQKRRGRCRDYDNKGYCARGHNCMYEHSNEAEGMFNNLPAPQMSGQIKLPPGGQSMFGSVPSSFAFNNSSYGQGRAIGRPERFQGGAPTPYPGGFGNINSFPSNGGGSAVPGKGSIAPKNNSFNPTLAFKSPGPGGESAASGHSSRRQDKGGLKQEIVIPGLGLLESQGGTAAPSSAVNFSSLRALDWPSLTQPADVQPSIENLINVANQIPTLPGPVGDVETDHDDRSNYRRDNRQGQQQRRNKNAGPNRAPFSHVGPMRDRTQTTVVVECIPEEHFEEQQVRDFFAQFGNILEVTMMPYKRLAIVKYDSWNSAMAAYKSPKVIFDNRFVKVFWYKDERHGDLSNGSGANGVKKEPSERNGLHASADVEEPAIDLEEFKQQQEEAQRAHEEKTRAKKELAEQRAELEKKRQELQVKQEAEKQKLLAKIAQKNAAKNGLEGEVKDESVEPSKAPTQTEVLRATLAKLQEEAKNIGLDPNAHLEEDATISTYSDYAPYPPRGRGGYYGRGRGGYTPRGSYRSRGGATGRGNIHAAYAAFSLDNRPRKVALTGVDFSNPSKDEALRQHLFSLGEFSADIEMTPAKTLVSFSDRKAAEKFFNTVGDALPAGDKVELAWVANTADPLPGGAVTSKIEANGDGGGATNGRSGDAAAGEEGLDAVMMDADGGKQQQQQQHGPAQPDRADDEDYDVAGDNEWDIS